MIKPKFGSVPISAIDPGVRSRREYINIEVLAADIAERNLLHPIVIKEKDDGSGYLLIAGGRRLKALSVLQWKDIPCNIYPPMDAYDTESAELAENIQREDLTYAERATSIKRVHELRVAKFGAAHKSSVGGHSLQDTADLIGMSEASVRREIKLASAIEMLPELAACKDASQAMKLYDRLEESLIREEIAKRADIILSTEGKDAIKRQLINNYIVGDFFTHAKNLPDRSFHCIEVDPPYGIDLAGTKKDDSGGTINYNEIAAKAYPEFLDKVMTECKRLLFDDGWLLLWFAANPWYEQARLRLESNGFGCVQPAIWIKQNGQTNWPDRYFASCWEPFFYGRKGNAILFKQGRSNIFNFPAVSPEKKIHPTERPVAMMTEILQCFAPPSARILVSFAGSGNTLLAANNLGMSAIGYDLAKEYKDAFVQRVIEGEVSCYE